MTARSERPERPGLSGAVAARRRAQMVSGLRGLAVRGAGGTVSAQRVDGGGVADAARSGDDGGGVADATRSAAAEVCDLCGLSIAPGHRHLLHLTERRIVCACEGCWAMRCGEGDYRPVGSRITWLTDFAIPDELWASLQIPIGLAFFMHSTVTECVVAMYPSPAGATESELHFESWARICALHPVLGGLEPDIEGLIVDRIADPAVHVIAPIDRCYELTGAIKLAWEGISGGSAVGEAVQSFFDRLRAA